MKYQKKIIITGGAGFIGSHVVRLFVKKYPQYLIINIDDLTYAGNLENLMDIEHYENYIFRKINICDTEKINHLFEEFQIDAIIHLAAESHVDRSIAEPLAFIQTNIVGTANLLIAAKKHWNHQFENKLFYHVSTDEVFGSLGTDGYFTESTPYDPRSPYSASKASSDHLVNSFFHTYQLPIVISNCSNNYGPNQFPEKLIPLTIHNIIKKQSIPVYGKGENIRDWLFVEDHAQAIDTIFHQGKIGETYNVGGNNEWKNIDLISLLCKLMDKKLGNQIGTSNQQINFVKDRAGHDLRYAIDNSKIQNQLAWQPKVNFEEGLSKTIQWYLENQTWLEHVVNGEYLTYYKNQYQS